MKKVANEKFEKKFAKKVKTENAQKDKDKERFNNNIKPFLVVSNDGDKQPTKNLSSQDRHNFKTILVILAIIAAFFLGLKLGTSENLNVRILNTLSNFLH